MRHLLVRAWRLAPGSILSTPDGEVKKCCVAPTSWSAPIRIPIDADSDADTDTDTDPRCLRVSSNVSVRR